MPKNVFGQLEIEEMNETRAETISEKQSQIAKAFENLRRFEGRLPDELQPLMYLAPPEGKQASVSLRRPTGKGTTGRQVKQNARSDSWSPETGLVSICYTDKPDVLKAQPRDLTVLDASPRTPDVEDPARDLVLILATAERDPKLGFVSLKWFRDTYVPRQACSWAGTAERRQQVLEDAINRNWVLTSKVSNPKNPQYPVTAIRVNRALPEVRRILQQENSAFVPIPIQGERLSDTVLRGRR